MNTLSLHIEYLLRRHDCVILPGVGAFIRTCRDACIDMERGIATPSTYDIAFNSDVNNEDAMLSNSYSRRRGVSFSEGKRMLRQDIDTLVHKLAYGEKVEIGRLGTLSKDATGRIQFRRIDTVQSQAALMGYPKIKIPGIEKKEKEVTGGDTQEATAVKAEPTDRRYVTWRIRKTWLGAAACLMVALLCLSVFVGSRFNPPQQKSPIQQAAVVPAIDRIDTATQPDAPALKPEQGQTAAGLEVDADEEAYYLIVATFCNEEDAHTYVGQKSDSRYRLMVVRGEKVYRVSAAMSSERHELRDIMKEEEFASRFVQPWIWHRD